MTNKRILILSSSNDISTNKVIDWINHFGYEFDRFNDQIQVQIQKIVLNSQEQYFIAYFNGTLVDSRNYSSYWYRRGVLLSESLTSDENFELDEYHHAVNKYITSDNEFVIKALHSILERKKCLGNFKNNFLSKIEVLIIALEVGLEIPQTIITTDFSNIRGEFEKNCRLITKSIQDSFRLVTPNGQLMQYTSELSEEPNTYFNPFSPSLIQSRINKDIELRIFYLNGECFSAAIFSQSNIRTQVDFRKYDRVKPNRCVPYKIDEELENKILKLMSSLELNTGSIDIIKTIEGKYIFLEVNPIGQFGQVSAPCNYYLEKKIAEYLCD